MTTNIDQLGKLELPKAIRVSRKIHAGDDFEIVADEDDFDLILLRRIRPVANAGLVRHLTACPDQRPLSTPVRRREPMRKVRL